MSKRHSSTNSDKNPYQRPEKINYFWHQTEGRIWGYSQATKDYFDERAKDFIKAELNSKKIQWIKK